MDDDSAERTSFFRASHQDVEAARAVHDTLQTRSPAYRLAFTDEDFLLREDMRPVRLQLELLKAQLILDERGIRSTVVMFGGARIPAPDHAAEAATEALAGLSHYYTEAETFARLITERSMNSYGKEFVICTGGGPGVMEAGNKGAHEAGGASIGLSIMLPHEQRPNAYITPDLSLNFHYFAIRKMHFLMRARAIVAFPGGFGTLDELFEALTLIQTGRMRKMPFLLFGRSFWERVIDWEALVEYGTISAEDIKLFSYVETAAEAAAIIANWDYSCD